MGLEKENEDLNSFQLSSMVLNKLDIHNGTITKFHQSRKGTLDYYTDLNKLQYDMLYGEQYVYNGEVPFERTKIQMGIEKIKVLEITNNFNDIYITGENFTESCQVFLNNESVDTIYVNDKTLKLEDKSLQFEDIIEIKVQTETDYTLSITDGFEYKKPIIHQIP